MLLTGSTCAVALPAVSTLPVASRCIGAPHGNAFGGRFGADIDDTNVEGDGCPFSAPQGAHFLKFRPAVISADHLEPARNISGESL